MTYKCHTKEEKHDSREIYRNKFIEMKFLFSFNFFKKINVCFKRCFGFISEQQSEGMRVRFLKKYDNVCRIPY